MMTAEGPDLKTLTARLETILGRLGRHRAAPHQAVSSRAGHQEMRTPRVSVT